MLEDMLVAALNETMRQIDEESSVNLKKVTGGLNIPDFKFKLYNNIIFLITEVINGL